jgi:predicted DNA-binding transcriptional regulator AlpA
MKSLEARLGGAVKPQHSFVLPEDARELWLGRISESTENRLRQTDPNFPKRVEISPGRTGYISSELDAYIALKIAQRDAGMKPGIVLSGERLGRFGKGGRPPGKARDKRQLDLVE